MSGALVRQWKILALLPKHPRRIDTSTLASRLAERGISVHPRTIQRDLVSLSELFPIVADERSKPFGWRWADEPGSIATSFAAAPPSVLRVRVRGTRADIRAFAGAVGARTWIEDGDGVHIVTVDIEMGDTRLARRLLLGHSDILEVVAPEALRRELHARAAAAAQTHFR